MGAGANLLGLSEDKCLKFDLITMQQIYTLLFVSGVFCFECSLVLNFLFRCLFVSISLCRTLANCTTTHPRLGPNQKSVLLYI